MATKDDALMKQFWQTYKFSLQDTSTSTREINQSIREKVDKLRSLLFFLRKLLACKKINETSFEILHKDLSLQYHSLVDSMDKDNGLDNYSDMMKALSDSKRNESRGWVSELSLEENRQPLCVKDLQRIEKKEPRNMKICFSKKHLHIQERSSEPSKKVEAKNIANTQHLQHSQHLQHFSQDSSRISSSNATSVPVFGKRKHNSFNGGYKDEMKKHLKTTSYFSSENNTGMKTSINGRSKAIIYGRETAFNSSSDDASSEKLQSENPFLTARDQLRVDMKKSGKALSYGQKKKCLGARGGVNGRFIPPIGQEKSERKQVYGEKKSDTPLDSKYEEFEWMKNIDPKMVELIENEVMDHGPQVSWDDIAGLEFAKTTIQEIVIWPMLRPDIFTGLRGPPKGLLLFGPPGTGKTLIGKCIASQSNAKFFNISASSLTSKWVGDGEKMVRALFGVARCEQPAVIFIDEIDSLLTQRSESEHESSRRIKTEFLVQLDGATASSDDRLLVVGATNRPQELDEAARRRLVKRLYIPLPDAGARKHIVNNLMSNQGNDLHEKDMDDITSKTNGFSGADMTNLCREAALGPIRNIADIRNINADEVRPINVTDFQNALKHVRPSVSQNDLQIYVNWNNLYGSGGVS